MPGTAAVVVLCGGFGAELKVEINVTTSTHAHRVDGTVGGLKQTVLLGAGGEFRVNPALVPVFARKNVEYLLRSLEGCRRLQPLNQHVTFVINDCDKQFFLAPDGSLFAECSDLGFTAANIVCNGARKASEWRGQLGDLAAAIPSLPPSTPTLVLSASLCLLPGFNLQRVLEHALVRNLDALCYAPLSPTDCLILNAHAAGNVWEVEPSASTVVPPLSGVAHTGRAAPGVLAAEHIMVIKPGTLAKLPPLIEALASSPGGHPDGPASLLPALASALLAGGTAVAGVELSNLRRIRLESARALDYADRFVHYYLWHMQPDETGSDDEVDSAVAQGSLNSMYAPVLADTVKLAATTKTFNAVYFGGEGETLTRTGDTTVLGTSGLQKYKLPSTFYMSQYRRTCADLLR